MSGEESLGAVPSGWQPPAHPGGDKTVSLKLKKACRSKGMKTGWGTQRKLLGSSPEQGGTWWLCAPTHILLASGCPAGTQSLQALVSKSVTCPALKAPIFHDVSRCRWSPTSSCCTASITGGFSWDLAGPLCPHLCFNLQLRRDLSLATVLGKNTQTQPFAGINSYKPQPSDMLERALKKQPTKRHDDDNPTALLKKEAVQEGLCQKTNQFNIKERRHHRQSSPSSPCPRHVFYLVGVAVLARRQRSRA